MSAAEVAWVGLKGGALSAYVHRVPDDFPKNESRWMPVLGGILLVCFLTLVLFPGLTVQKTICRKSEAQTAAANISSALKAYFMEYGKWPDYIDDGLFLEEKRQAQILHTLLGKEDADNPRKIAFLEGRIATPRPGASGRYAGGFSPKTGAFLDPQGNPYRIAIDADGDGRVANPYSDGPHSADPHTTDLLTRVIIWSLGKDGQLGAPANPRTLKGSDDVVSWQ